MSPTYAEAASLAFGDKRFTVSEFASRMGTPRAVRLLSELKVRGVVERVGRGRYRVLPPGERPDLRSVHWERVKRLLLDAGLPMVWTDADAVRVWTDGRYTLSPSAYLRRFHIRVPKERLEDWRLYLRKHGVSVDSRRRIGSTVVITVADHIPRSRHRGEPVMSKAETLALIRGHRGLYADADKLVESGTAGP